MANDELQTGKLTQYNVQIKVPGHPTGAYVEVEASSLNEAVKLAMESTWENDPPVEDINDPRFKNGAFPEEVWTEEQYTCEFTPEQIEQAWASLKEEASTRTNKTQANQK